MDKIINDIIFQAESVQYNLGAKYTEGMMANLLCHYINTHLKLDPIREKKLDIYYDNILIGHRYEDIYIKTEFGGLVIELKHLISPPKANILEQLQYYLEIDPDKPNHGLLIIWHKKDGFPLKDDPPIPNIQKLMYAKQIRYFPG